MKLTHFTTIYSKICCAEQADKFPEEVSPTNRFTFPRKKTGKFRRFSCTSSTQQGSGLGAGNSGNQQGTPGGPVKEKGLGIREEFKGSGSGSEKRVRIRFFVPFFEFFFPFFP